MVELELDDMQGFIARGYGNMPKACYLVLKIENAAAARGWLSASSLFIRACARSDAPYDPTCRGEGFVAKNSTSSPAVSTAGVLSASKLISSTVGTQRPKGATRAASSSGRVTLAIAPV